MFIMFFCKLFDFNKKLLFFGKIFLFNGYSSFLLEKTKLIQIKSRSSFFI